VYNGKCKHKYDLYQQENVGSGSFVLFKCTYQC